MSRAQELLQRKRQDVAARKTEHPLSAQDIPADDRRIRWSKNRFHIIAEIKRSSLSAGVIRPDLQLGSLARSYQEAGVSAISVLTEEHYFGGSLKDLRAVRSVASVPLLQKDFIVDEYQILEAKAASADFVLLIVRFLSQDQLSAFLSLCDEIKINALVEITNEKDLSRLNSPVAFLGVNSRDLETVEVDTAKFASLRKYLPETFLIAESGIHSTEALVQAVDLGYHGALIGEYFLRADDPGEKARTMVQDALRIPQSAIRNPKWKVCGITSERDALLAVDAGADALGFIFADSPRRIDPEHLLRFIHRIPAGVLCVGVFRGQTQEVVENLMRQFGFDIAQVYDPMNLPFPTWRARTISALSELDHQSGDLLDLKLEGEQLKAAWQALAGRDVFALAGNLHAGNVDQAVALCRPQWIDVARGVERSPGIKDENKLRDFITQMNTARQSRNQIFTAEAPRSQRKSNK